MTKRKMEEGVEIDLEEFREFAGLAEKHTWKPVFAPGKAGPTSKEKTPTGETPDQHRTRTGKCPVGFQFTGKQCKQTPKLASPWKREPPEPEKAVAKPTEKPAAEPKKPKLASPWKPKKEPEKSAEKPSATPSHSEKSAAAKAQAKKEPTEKEPRKPGFNKASWELVKDKDARDKHVKEKAAEAEDAGEKAAEKVAKKTSPKGIKAAEEEERRIRAAKKKGKKGKKGREPGKKGGEDWGKDKEGGGISKSSYGLVKGIFKSLAFATAATALVGFGPLTAILAGIYAAKTLIPAIDSFGHEHLVRGEGVEEGEAPDSMKRWGRMIGKLLSKELEKGIDDETMDQALSIYKAQQKGPKKESAPLLAARWMLEQGNPLNLLPGGRAQGRSPSEFDPYWLAVGAAIETEHTKDPRVAVEIAADHLAENPKYYAILLRLGL